MMPRLLELILVVGVGTATGCFNEAAGNDSCPAGNVTCACYGNGTCNGGLVCQDGVCRASDCRDGKEGCACLDGQCLGGLVCQDNTCTPIMDTETSDSTSTSTTTTSTTAAATTVGPTSAGTTLPTSGSATWGSTGPFPTSGGLTSGGQPCACGWAPINGGYYCTQEPTSDPNGAVPRECPDGTMAGAPCDSVSPPITSNEGCCLGESLNAYCGGNNVIVIDDCASTFFCVDG